MEQKIFTEDPGPAPAATPQTSEVVAEISKSLERTRTKLRKIVGELDDQINATLQRYQALQMGGISESIVADRIASALEGALQKGRQQLLMRASNAARLGAYVPSTKVAEASDGSLVKRTDERRVDLVRHDMSVVEVLALALNGQRIKTLAQEFAQSIGAGANEDGRTPAELQAEAARLLVDLEGLYGERRKAREQLQGFLDLTISPARSS